MASKSLPDRPNPYATIQYPPQLSSSDTILASRIELPKELRIVFTVFSPDAARSARPLDDIERLRRIVHTKNASLPLTESLLTSAHVGPSPHIYVFAIASIHQESHAVSRLNNLIVEGLNTSDPAAFTPCDLYPCSQACAGFNRACPSCCTSIFIENQRLHIVRESLRATYDHFLHAARSRAIDDMVQAASKIPGPQRRVVRFRDGILLGPPPSSGDWGYGWEHNATNRPLQLCHLRCQLSWNRDKYYLTFHPIITTTPFSPLSGFFPISSGSSITLLPFGTPAYFLARYTGPTSALTAQFDEALKGRGLGAWQASFRGKGHASPNGNVSDYIIAWISVENKQGEDKGITIIYPTELCLFFVSTCVRPPLDYLPTLPSQLQPSPEVSQSAPTSPTHTVTLFPSISSLASKPCLSSSPTADSIHAFRSLTLSKVKNLRGVASEVGGYVDAIARERERERERLKREREGALSISPKLSRAAATSTSSYPQSRSPDAGIVQPLPSIPPAPPPPMSHNTGSGPSVTLPASHQSFYPSPPQMANLTHVASTTSPVIIPSPALPQIAQAESSTPPLKGATPPLSPERLRPADYSETSYDPFESSWDQTPQGFDMDMDFGMEMNIGFNMTNLSSGDNVRGNFNDHANSLNFEDAFTDDDFNFFDRPSQKAIVPPVLHPSSSLTKGNPLALTIPPLFAEVSMGATNPLSELLNTAQLSPWSIPALGDPFTPRIGEPDRIPPELLPPSPGDTPQSQSVPPTPFIRSDLEQSLNHYKSTPQASTNFDPIPFPLYHRLADGKYTVGKFALPSPPSEGDDAILSVTSPKLSNGWRLRYDAITDPRISLVRRLIGVKRKFPQDHFPRNNSRLSPAWVRQTDEWETEKGDDDDEDSEADSGEDEIQEPETPIVSRPTTPPPHYLPLGPSLVHTHFQHTQLLSLSSPLRIHGTGMLSSNMISAPPIPSVPTPVSPAAALGAASEKSKSLEAAAFLIAQEAVENYVWASAWRAGVLPLKEPIDPWLSDARLISQLFGLVPDLEGPLDLKSLFFLEEPSSYAKAIQVMDMPSVAVGKESTIIQVLPSALRFWDKLGLGPRGGPKDFTAFVLFEDEGEERREQVAFWLSNLAAAYQGKHFGVLTPGLNSNSSVHGLIPLRFDPSFRKVLAHHVSHNVSTGVNVVYFIVISATAMTLGSQHFRTMLSAVKKALKAPSEAQVLFQLIPEEMVIGLNENQSLRDSDLEVLCCNTYNRILVPAERFGFTDVIQRKERIPKSFEEPMVTLARPTHSKISYALTPHAPLDVADSDAFLHIGYHVSPCDKWVLAAGIDQRGEAHDLGVWLTQTSGGDADGDLSQQEYIVNKIWEFTVQFSNRAGVEWRIAIARLGVIPEPELRAWKTLLDSKVTHSTDLRSLHVTLVCADPDATWTFITTKPTPMSTSKPPTVPNRTLSMGKSIGQSMFADISSSTYAVFPETPFHIPVPSSPLDPSLSTPYISEPVSSSSSPSPSPMMDSISPSQSKFDSPELHTSPILPHATSVLVRVPCSPSPTAITMLHIHLLETFHTPSACYSPASRDQAQLHSELTRNYYELSVLSHIRWGLNTNLILPFHLGAVEAMLVALDRDWATSSMDI